MKKLYTLLIVTCLSALILCQSGLCFPVSAATESSSTSYRLNAIDLIKLKKYIAGMDITLNNADYNGDTRVDSMDIATLRRIFLELSINPNDPSQVPEFDIEGYIKQVVKL